MGVEGVRGSKSETFSFISIYIRRSLGDICCEDIYKNHVLLYDQKKISNFNVNDNQTN